MTIAEYQTLTGNTVSDEDTTRVKAVIRRAESKLGALLGYSLSKQKQWTELGRVRSNGVIPFPSLPLADATRATLLPADEQVGDIQLFNYDPLNTHLRINPAKEVYRAKLVLPVSEDEFITVQDLDYVTPYLNGAGLVSGLTKHNSWFTWTWWNNLSWSQRGNLMLAVEAEYVNVCDANKYPDLAYLLTDMIDYYADENYSVLGVVRSESMDTHSYSRASTGKTPDEAAPQGQAEARKIIQRYAGPAVFGKLVR